MKIANVGAQFLGCRIVSRQNLLHCDDALGWVHGKRHKHFHGFTIAQDRQSYLLIWVYLPEQLLKILHCRHRLFF
jgi:hypothetical protein